MADEDEEHVLRDDFFITALQYIDRNRPSVRAQL